jgi:hypothetical protein
MFGDSALLPTPQNISRINAQMKIEADVLYRQTGDPDDRLVLVTNADGTYTTQTVRNQRLMQEGYSQNKTTMEHVFGIAAAVGVAGVLYYFVFKR